MPASAGEDAHFVCALDELAPGTMRRFDLGETPLVVCRSEDTGEVFAIDARCPHQGALLCYGELTGRKASAGASTQAQIRRGEIIRCPLHLWEFDVRTGSSLHIWPAVRTPTYGVRVEDGGIYVSRP
jgi:nitrite reductase/ring-hydroxylating ferredoxin subunit